MRSSPITEVAGILGSWCHWPVRGRCGYVHEEWDMARSGICSVVFDELDCLSADDIGEVVFLIVTAMLLQFTLVGDSIVVELAVCDKKRRDRSEEGRNGGRECRSVTQCQ